MEKWAEECIGADEENWDELVDWGRNIKENDVDNEIGSGPLGMIRMEATKEMWRQSAAQGGVDEKELEDINRDTWAVGKSCGEA